MNGFYSENGVNSTNQRLIFLLAQTANGNRIAFEALYREIVGNIYGYLRLRCSAEHDIHDILQETFLTVWQNAGQFSGASSVSTWIFGIARNKLFDKLRSKQRTEQNETWDEDDEKLSCSDFTGQVEARADWNQALASLPVHLQELAHLVFVEEMSYKEIAQILAIQEGTVKSRVHYMKLRLRKWLQEGGNRDGPQM
ncbi:RNA polymerase sigma factor [Alicyclobacillus fodiniaquatilis]|uniref:RNA polymerase sigma factor n=1 Tax=Alicyclobacillus fodiniaquatilis TaxID=1661150 RepID=A0ABW4JEJ0_9BACL